MNRYIKNLLIPAAAIYRYRYIIAIGGLVYEVSGGIGRVM